MEEGKPSSGKISLFDFLEDKLPLQSEYAEPSNPPQNSYTQSTENNCDKMEFKSNESQSGKSGRYTSLRIKFLRLYELQKQSLIKVFFI